MIRFKSHSGIYTLEASQKLPISLEEAWDFFTSPDNLSKITPSHMGFNVTSQNKDKVYPGMIITYKVAPFPGIKTNWVTEITQVVEKSYFIDEQRFGPYRMWHHEHFFEAIPGGVLMSDKISYKIPFWFIGNIAQHLFIKKQLTSIFDFRKVKLESMFPGEVIS